MRRTPCPFTTLHQLSLAAVTAVLATGGGCTSAASTGSSGGQQITTGAAGTSGGTTSAASTGTGSGGTASAGTTGGGFVPGPTCNPAGPNTCDAGTVCSLVSPTTSSIGFECQPPAEFYPCTPGKDCITSNLTCTTFSNGSFCVQPCTTSDDCFDFLMSCTAVPGGGLCLPRECGPGSTPANGAALMASCNAADAGDGTCVTLAFSDGAPGGCARAGVLREGDDCSYYAFSGGTQGFCGPGLTCLVSTVDGVSARCLPVCDGSHGCAAGQTCVVALPPVNPPPLSALTVSLGWGACADNCAAGSPDGGCGSGFLCEPNTFSPGTGDVCQPM